MRRLEMNVSIELVEYEGDLLIRIPRGHALASITLAFVEVRLRLS